MPEKQEEIENIYARVGKEIGELVASKQRAYGDSFGKANKILEVLYPNGIKVEQYSTILTITRVLDKLFRIATQPTYNGENPWQDAMGYCLLEVVKGLKNDNNIPQ